MPILSNCNLKKLEEYWMRKVTASLGAVILPVGIAIVLAACGSSPGGSGFPGDNTAPVTTANPTGTTVTSGDTITFTCTDDSSGCKEGWASAQLRYSGTQFFKVFDINASGSSTTFSIQISGGHTVGQYYDFQFYSIDSSDNREVTKSEVYLIQ